jgi:EpsD family peptidyl-prolyl cis-trans isomerase
MNIVRDTRYRTPWAIALVAAAALALLAGCGDKPENKPASQTAVKVNKDEITVHQINFVLQQQRGLQSDQVDGASKQILERLIDQELALQKASELKLDRDPRVVQQVEAAKREIVSRAYLERVSDSASKPTPAEIQKYYDEKPALFKDRRVYNLQEIAIEARPEQVAGLRTQLASSKTISEFLDYLKANNYRHTGNQAVRSAEQLPLASLDSFAQMKDGESVLNPTPTGAQVIALAASRVQPVGLEQATPAIEQFLLNERKRDVVTKDIKSLRDAAKIEYVGKFAESAAPAQAAVADTPVAPAAPAASTAPAAVAMDSATINKGLGIK